MITASSKHLTGLSNATLVGSNNTQKLGTITRFEDVLEPKCSTKKLRSEEGTRSIFSKTSEYKMMGSLQVAVHGIHVVLEQSEGDCSACM